VYSTFSPSAYGKVFLVRKVGGADQGAIYAMKVLRKARVMQKAKTLEHTIAERQVLEHIKNSPFLVNLRYAFQTDAKLHLVMGWLFEFSSWVNRDSCTDYIRGGELFTHLCSRGSFDMPTTRYYIAELVVALEHIHKRGIFYRDLKLENVMIDAEGHLTLTDFGLSKEFEIDEVGVSFEFMYLSENTVAPRQLLLWHY
jgi:serine/threonine protein kinase